MEKSSILHRTGQTWKLYLFYGGNVAVVTFGSLFLLMKSAIPPMYHGMLMLLIGSLGALSIVFPIAAIRCPVCGTRWLLRALQSKPGPDMPRLLGLTACPVCGKQDKSRIDDGR